MRLDPRVKLATAIACLSTSSIDAFQVPSRAIKSNYKVDQVRFKASVADETSAAATGESKFTSLLEEIGLSGENALKSLDALPPKRSVSADDVFCNRELKLGNIRAVGFGKYMSYLLPQFGELKMYINIHSHTMCFLIRYGLHYCSV